MHFASRSHELTPGKYNLNVINYVMQVRVKIVGEFSLLSLHICLFVCFSIFTQ